MENIRILLVEGDRVDQMAFERLVKDENLSYDYDIAGSVSEARRILDSKRFDIAIVDCSLGDGTAFDIFGLVKDTPIIVVIGAGDEKIAIIKAMKEEACDYLIKDPEHNYLKVLPVIVESAIKHKKTEKQFRMLSHAIMNINDSVYITDMDDRITFVNKAFCKIYGYEEEDVIGRHISVLWSEASTNRDVKSISSKRDGWRGEFYHRRRDGSEFPVSLSRSVIKDEDGNELAIVEVVRDITEQKRAEEALRQSEERYRTLFDQSPVGVFIFDKELTIKQCNERLVHILQSSHDRIIGFNMRGLKDQSYIPAIIKTLEGQSSHYEGFYKATTSSAELWLSIRLSPLRDNNGNVTGGMGVMEDITERNQAEEKIREQAELLNKAQDAIIVIDLEGHVLFCNERTLRLYGLDGVVNEPEELIGKTINELLYKGDSSQVEKAKKTTLEKGEWNGELQQVTKDGKNVVVESRWTLIRDNKSRPKSILIINTDVTEKKKLEAQFLRAQRMESVGVLAGGIAHDLNNVLSPIMMALGILRTRFTDERSQDILNVLETSAQRGANLVKQVLSFTRGLEGERAILQERHLISEIEKILKETFPKSIEISTDVPKDLWAITGDPTQLHQVLMNLCVNARDAMPNGGRLNISAENIFIDENYARMNIDARVGPYIAISVSDTGTGIPPEIMNRVFEPFFTTKGLGKGTGLGLSTAFGIVRDHGGFINVYSEVGKGTKFKVYLPAIETTEIKELHEKHLELPAGHGELILVVDDEASVLEITKVILEASRYRVITASDGTEAVALYLQNKGEIKLVLMDMMMPIMDGPASIRALRSVNPQVKVIAVSGLNEDDKLAEITGTGVCTFLSKPYTAETLLKTLYSVLITE